MLQRSFLKQIKVIMEFPATYQKTDMGLIHLHTRGFDHFKTKIFKMERYLREMRGTSRVALEKVYDKIKGKTEEEMRKGGWAVLILIREIIRKYLYHFKKDKRIKKQ